MSTPGTEFYNELAAVHGEAFKKAIHEFTVKLHEDDPELDLRLFGLACGAGGLEVV
ncbi:MAG: hypothetical protein ACLUS6_16880 [Dysosmobacter sp.]